MKEIKGGDRVRFEDDERLDIPDALALQELNYEYTSDVAAAIVGGSKANNAPLPVGGTMSRLVFNTSTPSATTIRGPQGQSNSKALFLYTYLAQTGYGESQVLIYDPSKSGQQNTINLSGYTSGQTVYIWAKRFDQFTDWDTRKKWDTVSGAEEPFGMSTRERYTIDFGVTTTTSAPGTDVGWFCVAIGRLSGSTWSFRMVHPFDCGRVPTEFAASDFSTGHAPHSAMFAISGYDYVGIAQTELLQWKTFYDNATAQATVNNSLQSQITAAAAAAAAAQSTATTADGKATTLQNTVPTQLAAISAKTAKWIAVFEYSTTLSPSPGWILTYVTPAMAAYLEITINNNWDFAFILYNPATANKFIAQILFQNNVSIQPYCCFLQTGIVSLQTNVWVQLQTYSNLSTGVMPSTAPSGNPVNGTQIVVVGYDG